MIYWMQLRRRQGEIAGKYIRGEISAKEFDELWLEAEKHFSKKASA